MTDTTEIRAGEAVRLAPGVLRLTAPNPGIFTGPGTNTYLLGDNQTLVLDPGPDMPEHIDAILAAAPGPISTIVVTHTHPDHSPGAAPLAERTGAPVLGLEPDYPSEGNGLDWTPDRRLQHGEEILCDGLKLRVVHTPGHASNHLCFLLESEGMLFSGDHVMQGSTVVIAPPDGDMAAYMRSLALLNTLPIRCIAPGHGHPITEPVAEVEALLAHRLKRENKTLDKLATFNEGCRLDELVSKVYDDVGEHLFPLATHSLLAHLLKLQGESRAHCSGDLWYPAS